MHKRYRLSRVIRSQLPEIAVDQAAAESAPGSQGGELIGGHSCPRTPCDRFVLTQRWREADSNLWSHFEIGTANVRANDREFV